MTFLRVFFGFFFLVLELFLHGQNRLSDRLFGTLYVGLGGGNEMILLSGVPQIGCDVTDRYSAGVGMIYQYVRSIGPRETIHNYGWSVFNRYKITKRFFGYGEFERLSFQRPPRFQGRSGVPDRRELYSVFLGPGFANPLSRNSSLKIMVLYNLLYVKGETSPYSNSWLLRVGLEI
ncbi:MAG: hypothetical protein AAF616_12320 [Bacteroidota bacterium]